MNLMTFISHTQMVYSVDISREERRKEILKKGVIQKQLQRGQTQNRRGTYTLYLPLPR